MPSLRITPAYFERPIDRRSGDSVKWNKYDGQDIIPLWVADMDFAAPEAVLKTLQRRIEHGVLGYAAPWPSLIDAVLAHLKDQYDWQIDPEWLVWLPGVVTGLSLACRAVDGDVIMATPVYPPFLSAPGEAGKKCIAVALRQNDGRWEWDFAAMEAALTPNTRLLLLCHPHNPVGRAWSVAEQRELATFCLRHQIYVCSDEIHCDLVLKEGHRHQPTALDAELARRCITLMAPSKTYNIAGLGCAFAVISEPSLRRRFLDAMRGIVPGVNVLGFVAAEAAYREGEAWRTTLIEVLRTNSQRVHSAVSAMPGLEMGVVEATYLAWIDARKLAAWGIGNPVHFFEKAGVGLSDGADFGAPGWLRLNFGCPRDTLEEALQRMHKACRAAQAAAA